MLANHARLVANARRARTVAEREQERGKTDLSVQQTRRMYFAVGALQRAAFKLAQRAAGIAHMVAAGRSRALLR